MHDRGNPDGYAEDFLSNLRFGTEVVHRIVKFFRFSRAFHLHHSLASTFSGSRLNEIKASEDLSSRSFHLGPVIGFLKRQEESLWQAWIML